MSQPFEKLDNHNGQETLASTQTLYFNKTVDWKTENVTASDVLIVPGEGVHAKGSSRVKVRSIVDSAWDRGYIWGNLVACHFKGEYFAYALKVPGKSEGVVRVFHSVGNSRILLKGFRGQVRDLAFSFHGNRVLLASIDEYGLILVHEISCGSSQLVCQIEHNVTGSTSEYCRVLWCPSLPYGSQLDAESDPASDSDVSLLLGAIHDNIVEVWHLGSVAGSVNYDSVSSGVMTIKAFQKPVLDASFSPDGTAIALAGLDGYVRFFTVSLDKQEPSTLHEWKPHDGRPVTSINFLDNLISTNPDTALWKSVITSTDFCTELKIWSCETWTPYQTVRFQHDVSSNRIMQKVYLDLSASVLLVTDPQRKAMYVMQIDQDKDGYRTTVSSVTHLLLSFSPISLAIRKAETEVSGPHAITVEDEDERELALDSGDASVLPIMLDFYVIQPKSLQKCKALFYPGALPSAASTASFSQSSAAASLNTTSTSLPEYEAPQFSGATISLLTPEAFTSASRSESATTPKAASPALPVPKTEGSTPENGLNSGESSPSREVEEILGSRPVTEGGLYVQPAPQSPEIAPVTELQEAAAALAPSLASPNYRNNEIHRDGLSAFHDIQFHGKDTGESGATATTPSSGNINTFLKDIVPPSLPSPHSANGPWPTVPLPRVSSGRGSEQPAPLNGSMEQTLGTMQRSLNEITEYMKAQQAQSAALYGEVNRLKAEVAALQSSNTPPGWYPHLEAQMSLLFDREMKKQKTLNNPAKMQQSLSKLEQMLKAELDKKSSLNEDALKRELSSTVSTQMVRVESSVREALAQLLPQALRDKNLLESYSQAVASIAGTAVNKAVRDAVAQQLAPAFERCCASLYSQLHATFTRGMEELFRSMTSNLEMQRQNTEKITAAQLADVGHKMTATTNQCRDLLVAEMNNHFAKLTREACDQISSKISVSLHSELQRGFQEQKLALQRTLAAVESQARAATPAPVNTLEMLKNHLNQLVTQGEYLEAFQRALSASDLNTVLYVCELVDPQQLFGSSPCPLPQPVLLSLIQQLSADLGSNTELKVSYLQEAILAVDVRDKVAKEHAPSVMKQLIVQLQSQMGLTTGPLNRKIRMLLLAAQQLQSS